jgi:hypothetical protein
MVATALKNHVHVDAVHTNFIYTIFGVNGYRLCQALCAGVLYFACRSNAAVLEPFRGLLTLC